MAVGGSPTRRLAARRMRAAMTDLSWPWTRPRRVEPVERRPPATAGRRPSSARVRSRGRSASRSWRPIGTESSSATATTSETSCKPSGAPPTGGSSRTPRPTGRRCSRLGSHVDPFLALFAPLWWVWPSPGDDHDAAGGGPLPPARSPSSGSRASTPATLGPRSASPSRISCSRLFSGTHSTTSTPSRSRFPSSSSACGSSTRTRPRPGVLFGVLAASTKENSASSSPGSPSGTRSSSAVGSLASTLAGARYSHGPRSRSGS